MENNILKNQRGFTLLEVIIALAIMMVAIASVLSVESGAINASSRARQLNIVAMLAENQMIETENKIEGKTFDEVKKEDQGVFPDPYQDYRWTSVVKEIDFPTLNFSPPGNDKSGSSQDTVQAEQYSKLISQFLSKALREVNVTIIWKRGPGEQKFTVADYWVDLNHEFEVTQ